MLGTSTDVTSNPTQHARAMAPEANDMLSLHEGIEVDVIIEGRPLDGDRYANAALSYHEQQLLAREPCCILAAQSF